jgi:hypothetical protein
MKSANLRRNKVNEGAHIGHIPADLKFWNEVVFGNIERHKKPLLEELQVLDVLEE